MNNEYNTDALDYMAVMRFSSAYWQSSVIHTATSLDIFTKLAGSSATAKELADQCQANCRGMELILIACVGMGLLKKEMERFSNTTLSDTFLVKSSPRFQGGIASMFEEWVPAWAKLKESVITGKQVESKQHDQGDEATRNYIMGLYYRGIPQAKLLGQEVSLAGKKRLLDVGAGPGIFSVILCQMNPGLEADAFDLPQTLNFTKEIIAKYEDIKDVVSTKEGDYLKDDFGKGYDAVLLSSMTNQESPGVIKDILRKSFQSMNSGGLLMIQEQLLDDDKKGPLLACLIGINQLLQTPGGGAYSAKEMAEWAEEIGFRDLHCRPLPDNNPFTLITGVKP